jgi:plasmid stabilization system protein ParE
MYRIVLSPPAKEDIREAAKWYNKRKTGLGKQFTARIKETTAYIKEDPFIAQVRFDDVHVAVAKQFPYSVHYKIKEELKTVLIHAVLHDHRNPDLWPDRAEDD